MWVQRGRIYRGIYSDHEITEFCKSQRIFFLLGAGRSGTQLVSSLLNQNSNAVVLHEPSFYEDVLVMDECRNNQNMAYKYLYDFRRYEIFREMKRHKNQIIYGEVTGTLRFHCSALKKIFPNASLLILVRDGRDFVRSVMGWRQFYSYGSRGAWALSPNKGEEYYAEWERMSRFEKVCWFWMDSQKAVLKYIPAADSVMLESVASDYRYFTEQLCKKLGLNVPQEIWGNIVTRRSKNSTRKYVFPEWNDWSVEEKKSFERICGPTMRLFGYSI